MRVVICWIGTSGYLAACWRALAAWPGIDLRVVVFPGVGTKDAPFGRDVIAGIRCDVLQNSQLRDFELVAGMVAAHRPDVVVIAGWAIPVFRRLVFDPSLRHARFAMAMDTARTDSWRQRFARLRMGRFFDRIGRVICAGERSWQFARRLVPEAKVRRGMNGFDSAQFAPAMAARTAGGRPWPRRFLFCGRYVPEKGLAALLDAYQIYRTTAADPWSLSTCGRGPLAATVAGAGVTDLGFIQPAHQPTVFADHGVMVLPSDYEPWGVVIAEALGSGMPVICTEACGALVEMVRSYYNGLIVPTGSVESLARAMRWMDDHYDRVPEFGRRGQGAAAAFSETCWAERWANLCQELVDERSDPGPGPHP